MIKKWELYSVLLIAALVINVIIAGHFYDIGKRKVALKSTEDSLVVVQKEKAIISHQRDSIGNALRIADNKTTESRIVYIHDTRTTTIIGDTAKDSSGKFIQVLDHRITQRIKDADTHIGRLERELATAKSLVRIDTVFIIKDNQEIGLHKSIEKLISAPRLSHGFQAGIGYCRNSIGGTPCVYVGYGFSVRF